MNHTSSRMELTMRPPPKLAWTGTRSIMLAFLRCTTCHAGADVIDDVTVQPRLLDSPVLIPPSSDASVGMCVAEHITAVLVLPGLPVSPPKAIKIQSALRPQLDSTSSSTTMRKHKTMVNSKSVGPPGSAA
ncbi:hypothetical protein EJB05_35012 [Eragrostis curvula]|uniref:Uncharacterized protein n=1 Tax=Eragrostis curvula TaxID=38414 RepID=A0A5J9U5S1_9POAL|nr:hypothetical protein EJB05_35012 [Eragrostis curvula]